MHGLGSVSCRGVTWRAKWSLGFILQYRCMKAKNRVRMSHRNQHGVTDIRLYHTWPPTRLFNPTYKNMDTEPMSRAVRLFTFPPTTGACLVSRVTGEQLGCDCYMAAFRSESNSPPVRCFLTLESNGPWLYCARRATKHLHGTIPFSVTTQLKGLIRALVLHRRRPKWSEFKQNAE